MKPLRDPWIPRFVRRHKAHHYGFRFAGHEAFFDQDWEARERAIVEDRLAGADVLIDVGACHGIYSCLGASMGRHVAAFEPDPRNLRFLLSNVRANGFDTVEVFPVALSAAVGVREFFGHRDIASLTPGWFGGGFGAERRRAARLVPTNTLDNLFAARWRDARILVKLDAEGAEHDVLRGAESLLARARKPDWLIETFPMRQDRPDEPNPDFGALFRLMFRHGYRCRHTDTGREVTGATLAEWEARPADVDLGASNFFFEADR